VVVVVVTCCAAYTAPRAAQRAQHLELATSPALSQNLASRFAALQPPLHQTSPLSDDRTKTNMQCNGRLQCDRPVKAHAACTMQSMQIHSLPLHVDHPHGPGHERPREPVLGPLRQFTSIPCPSTSITCWCCTMAHCTFVQTSRCPSITGPSSKFFGKEACFQAQQTCLVCTFA
jgi:hypothetical protein